MLLLVWYSKQRGHWWRWRGNNGRFNSIQPLERVVSTFLPFLVGRNATCAVHQAEAAGISKLILFCYFDATVNKNRHSKFISCFVFKARTQLFISDHFVMYIYGGRRKIWRQTAGVIFYCFIGNFVSVVNCLTIPRPHSRTGSLVWMRMLGGSMIL